MSYPWKPELQRLEQGAAETSQAPESELVFVYPDISLTGSDLGPVFSPRLSAAVIQG